MDSDLECFVHEKCMEIRDKIRERVEVAIFLGIDPGASGGIAAIVGDEVYTWKMPEDENALVSLFEEVQVSFEPISLCLVEKQHSMPATAINPEGQTVQVQGVVSTFSFAEHYGVIRGILADRKIRREFIAPREWQKLLGIPPRRKKEHPETKTEWKQRLRAKAQELFPNVKVTLYISDALLIAETARRMENK